MYKKFMKWSHWQVFTSRFINLLMYNNQVYFLSYLKLHSKQKSNDATWQQTLHFSPCSRFAL